MLMKVTICFPVIVKQNKRQIMNCSSIKNHPLNHSSFENDWEGGEQ